MKVQYKKLIVFAVLLQLLCFAFIIPAQSQVTVPMQVNRAVWGESLNSPINVYPGDEGVSFIVEMQNLGETYTLKGISGILQLENTSFTDIYGNTNATATGAPTIGDLLNPSDQVASSGFFTMTFHLNVKEEAIPASYMLNLLVNYSYNTLFSYTKGVTQTLNVTCAVSSTASTVSLSVSPAKLDNGEQVKLSGNLQPAMENANINLAFQDPNGNKFNQTATTKFDGSFNYSYTPKTAGYWTVNASWAGDAQNKGNSATTSFEVHLPISLALSVPNDRIKAGYDNQLNLTLKNDGKVAFSSLNFSYTVPPPLVSSGKSQWLLSSLDAGKNFSVPIVLYAPFASVGNTYSSNFIVTCKDDYGQMQSYQFSVGLVIVGNVELGVYDSVVKPQIAINGSEVEITTTLLNRGTVPAIYVNASILPNAILDLSSQSSVYIGDVDENSQAPFTLTANVNKNAQNGTYPVTMRIDYRNDQNLDNSFNYTFNLQVTTNTQSDTIKNDVAGYPEIGLVVAIIAVAACLIVLAYRRQVNKSKKIRANR